MLRRFIFMSVMLQVLALMLAPPGNGDAHAASLPGVDSAPHGSPAAGDLKTAGEGGVIKRCKEIPEAQGGVLLGVIIPCITYTIEKTTQEFSREMIDWLRPLLYTFLTLVVVLFGVRMLQQEPNLEKQGFILLLKIALVVLVLDNTPDYIVPSIYGVMNNSQSIVLGAIDATSLTCNVDQYSGPNTPRVWATMDCVMGKLFGFTTGSTLGSAGEKTPNMLLATSMFGLLIGFFFGGAWGVVVFFGMLGVLISIFLLVIRTAMAFLSGYLVICIMLILLPLLLPLVFMRVTQTHFEAVQRNILASLLMPVIVTAYSMFALILYDKMLFAPDSIIQKIFNYDEVKDALQNSRKACDWQVTGDATALRLEENPDEARIKRLFHPNGPLGNNIMQQLTGANDVCAKALIPNLNIRDMKSEEFKKGKASYEKIFYELLTLLILGYMIYLGMDNLENITLQLTGAATISLGFNKLPGEEKITQAAGNVKNQMMAARDSAGADYLERAPLDTAAGIRTFFETIGKPAK